MDLGLKDKVVLITGGSKGIGLACARAFLREGAIVTLVARDAGRLDTVRHALRAEFPQGRIGIQAADLQSADAALQAIDRAESEPGPVAILVNSAGAARRTPPGELTPQHWRDAMDAKYFTTLHVIDPLIKRMAARGAGVIVNVIGMGGKTPTATHLPGGAANAALMLATAGLAAAYGPRGVRVNAVNPSSTRTDRLQQGIEADARLHGLSIEEAQQRITARLPLGRMAEPQEVADVVTFLASPRASYVSGAIVSMDGAAVPMVV
jgi:NAD(P)-dependent dehydrogenase (short-subunit alcohol dehydrogenase family)